LMRATRTAPTGVLRTRVLAVLPLVVLLVSTLPFWSRPMHIDDPMFVAMADAIRRDPGAPYAFRAVWDEREEDGARIMASPPFYGYALAAADALFEEPGAAARFVGLLFALILVLALGSLARRFGVPAWALALLVVSAPAFVVMVPTAMPDVVLGSLLTTAIAA